MESMEGYDMSLEGWDNLYKQLWKACAGSIVDLPEAGDLVFYFPQGHLEQLEESTSLELDHILFTLPSKIHCRVINIQLRADTVDDDVFAQITLLPEEKQDHSHLAGNPGSYAPQIPEPYPPQIPEPKFYSFSKVLSASDINAHCRLHVLKQHAEKCLPPLDMTQQTPSQELRAKDLSGTKWTFKHVFGGQPRRHLFTTGWSNFVNSKGLVAGDSFVFLRGENGELGVGIRRLSRPCISNPSPWFPSESVVGVLATVSQAIATGTLFSVYYRPRKSKFIVGLNKYLEADNHGFSVGMRYSMRFKGNDLTQRRYTGIIVGVDDIDSRWQNSAWRSLKVQWDESTSTARPERVSPWEIEPLVASSPLRLVPPVGTKSKNKGKIPRSQLAKRRKSKSEPQEKCMEHLGAMTMELPQPGVPSRESAGKRCDDMPLVLASETYDFDKHQAYNCEDDPRTRDGSVHMSSNSLVPGSSSSGNGITQPNFHGQSNLVLIDEHQDTGVGGHYVSETAHAIPSPNPASDRSDSWFMALLRDSPEQFECQSESSLFREQHFPKDPCMPSQQTSSTELPRFPKGVFISSIPNQIPFTGPGIGNEPINWGAYRVARRCVPILERVNKRYPATLSSFRAMSGTLRSMFLEILAEVVFTLEQLKVANMDVEHLDNAKRYIMDLKMSGIDMSWLEGRLNHISGICKKNRLVQRREELAMEVAEANAKLRRLEGELSSLDLNLRSWPPELTLTLFLLTNLLSRVCCSF